jgi:glycosyltransferase involved in cell wall biosynthesis
LKDKIRSFGRSLNIYYDKIGSRFKQYDISIFHEFSPPPSGGGHQFMRALWSEFKRRSLRTENNTISVTCRSCLFNSFNFDFKRLKSLYRPSCYMVHRVDGPVGVYRGSDDGTDYRIWQINQSIANATIFQSNYSLQKYLDLGLTFKSPFVIRNASNPEIFHDQGRIPFTRNRKIKLISTSWSDNPNKGASVYKWLDNHLDWDHFEYTFVGRSKISFNRIRMLPPVPSSTLAEILRQHDIFIIASQHDPCSNALIEALSCGLPAIFLKSGGHQEIVGEAGLGFDSEVEIPGLLDHLINEFEIRQTQILLPTLSDVADQYLSIMKIQ